MPLFCVLKCKWQSKYTYITHIMRSVSTCHLTITNENFPSDLIELCTDISKWAHCWWRRCAQICNSVWQHPSKLNMQSAFCALAMLLPIFHSLPQNWWCCHEVLSNRLVIWCENEQAQPPGSCCKHVENILWILLLVCITWMFSLLKLLW